MHRGFTGESLVPSYGDKSKRSRKGVKPGKRIKVAEQGRVYGNLRLIHKTLNLQRKEEKNKMKLKQIDPPTKTNFVPPFPN